MAGAGAWARRGRGRARVPALRRRRAARRPPAMTRRQDEPEHRQRHRLAVDALVLNTGRIDAFGIVHPSKLRTSSASSRAGCIVARPSLPPPSGILRGPGPLRLVEPEAGRAGRPPCVVPPTIDFVSRVLTTRRRWLQLTHSDLDSRSFAVVRRNSKLHAYQAFSDIRGHWRTPSGRPGSVGGQGFEPSASPDDQAVPPWRDGLCDICAPVSVTSVIGPGCPGCDSNWRDHRSRPPATPK